MSTRYDLAIVGSGGAAFAAAIAARRAGRTVVMIDRGTVGGTCVNTGCVPSKALLAAAEARHVAGADAFPGIATAAGAVDGAALFGGVRQIVDGMRATKYVDLAAGYGWPIIAGTARFVDGPVLRVDHAGGEVSDVAAEHYLIATGSAAWAPPIAGLTEVPYLTSDTALALDAVPASLLVLGGGFVGLELAQLFARLGTEVTMVVRSRLAAAEEPEISAGIQRVFADEGITVHTGVTLHGVADAGGRVTATLSGPGGPRLTADHLLVATGRRAVTEHLNLAAVGVKTGSHGAVVVDEQLRTHHPRIWAAGDVTGHPGFVYVAATHGAMVVDNAFAGAGRTLDYRHLPRVTFTAPAIASVGLTEAAAAERDQPFESRVLSLEHVPRAVVNRDTRGLIKLLAEPGSGRLLGAHVLADGAGDVIAAAVTALAHRMTVRRLAGQWSPYLTMAEGLKLAAQSFTRDVTTLSCCAT